MKFLLLLLGTAFAVGEVIVLTDDTIDDALKKYPRMLVEFYAPWCGHCKKLEPEYNNAAFKLKEKGIETVLAKVDATVEKKCATKYGVRGFPTLKYFVDGKSSEYGGGRTSDTIVSWLAKRAGPAVTILKSKEDIESFAKKDRLVLVGFYEKETDKAKFFDTYANAERDNYTFGLVTSEALAKEMEIPWGTAVLYREMNVSTDQRTFDEPIAKLEGLNIAQFLKVEGFPLLAEMGPGNYRQYMERGLPMAWISLDLAADNFVELKTIAKKFAKEQKGKLSFTYVDGKKYKEMLDSIGLTSVPGMMVREVPSKEKSLIPEKKYRLEEDFSADSLKKFFSAYEAGELPPYLKSEKAPETQDKAVIVAVGTTFDSIVKAKKGVLVKFYAPWCGHCKALAPKYEEAAKKLKDKENVMLVKIDVTVNDIVGETIKSYPTLIWYPVDYPTVPKITYDGGRETDAIVDWITEQMKGDDAEIPAEKTEIVEKKDEKEADKEKKAEKKDEKEKIEL